MIPVLCLLWPEGTDRSIHVRENGDVIQREGLESVQWIDGPLVRRLCCEEKEPERSPEAKRTVCLGHVTCVIMCDMSIISLGWPFFTSEGW